MKIEDRSVLPLCDFVNGFPAVYLHQNGKFKEEMLGDLNYNLTLNWIKNMTIKYTSTPSLNTLNISKAVVNTTLNSTTNLESRLNASKVNVSSGLEKLRDILEKEREPSPDINPNGQIVHLTDDDFEEVSKSIDFRKLLEKFGL